MIGEHMRELRDALIDNIDAMLDVLENPDSTKEEKMAEVMKQITENSLILSDFVTEYKIF